MAEKPSVGITMVSRLPKFGGRSSTGGASSLPNGSSQPTIPSQDTKTTATATPPNGLVRKPSFSLKWRRDATSTQSTALTPTNSSSPEDVKTQEAKPQTPLLLGKEAKNSSPGTPKLRRSGASILSVSSQNAVLKQATKVSSPKLAQAPLGAPTNPQKVSSSSIRPQSMFGSESRLVLPKRTCSLHNSGSQDSLSLSSDSLKNMCMDNMVRSHSFTHFKQIPSPTCQPMTRSFSFNRAVELAKPLANTNLRPPQTSFLKPPQLSNGKAGLGGSLGGLGGGFPLSRASSAATSVSSLSNYSSSVLTTPTALKKPLLPRCMTTKPLGGSIGGSLAYKLARPGQTKLQKPLFMGQMKGNAKPAMGPGCGGKSVNDVEDPDTSEFIKSAKTSDGETNSNGRCGGGGRLSYATVAVEALEDMSLSSASSLDRVDTSEEFLADVDSGADTFSDGDLGDTQTGSSTQKRLRHFLNETMEWSNIDAAGGKEDIALQGSKCSPAVSPEEGDLLQGSSLELSPSNSSGGTYMWDEEGLEPLGGAGLRPRDSFDDPDLNSTDLDDNDLMLQLDLPEDLLQNQDSDRMSTGGRSEKAGRHGHWRRRQHRWNAPDHFHNDNKLDTHNRGLVYCNGPRGQGSMRGQPRPELPQPEQPAGGEDDGAIGAGLPDELTLKHMAQDYSSLTKQLLKLQTILQFEDADGIATAEEGEVNTTALQLEELMHEVRVLRGELRSRDKTIAMLTMRCQQLQQQHHNTQHLPPTQGGPGRCHCQHQQPPSDLRFMDRRHHNKSTQTHLRTHSQTPQVLQPSSLSLQPRPPLERLAKPPTAVPSDSWEQDEEEEEEEEGEQEARSARGRDPASDHLAGGLVSRRAHGETPDGDELSVLLGTSLHLSAPPGYSTPQAGGDRGSPPCSAAQCGPQRRPPAATPMCSDRGPRRAPSPSSPLHLLPSTPSGCPRMLQPPRLHKRVSLPALRPAVTLRRGGSQRLEGDPRNGQLPPPTRGLPCFDGGLRAQEEGARRAVPAEPRTTAWLLRNPGRGDGTALAPAPGFRYPGASEVLLPSGHTCLPRPKIHYGAHQT